MNNCISIINNHKPRKWGKIIFILAYSNLIAMNEKLLIKEAG